MNTEIPYTVGCRVVMRAGQADGQTDRWTNRQTDRQTATRAEGKNLKHITQVAPKYSSNSVMRLPSMKQRKKLILCSSFQSINSINLKKCYQIIYVMPSIGFIPFHQMTFYFNDIVFMSIFRSLPPISSANEGESSSRYNLLLFLTLSHSYKIFLKNILGHLLDICVNV